MFNSNIFLKNAKQTKTQHVYDLLEPYCQGFLDLFQTNQLNIPYSAPPFHGCMKVSTCWGFDFRNSVYRLFLKQIRVPSNNVVAINDCPVSLAKQATPVSHKDNGLDYIIL